MKSQIKHLLILMLIIAAMSSGLLFLNSKRVEKSNIKNILLISIDTCRADHLGCYGCAKNTTPNIDAISEEAFIFDNAISPVPQTLPAHSSMLTGKSPLSHNIHDNLGYQLAESHTTLPEILTDNGYKTGAVISAFVLDSQFGLDQGFESYNDNFEDAVNSSNVSERRADETTRFAIEWLNENKTDKFFLFLHYFDPHFRYTPPEPYASKFADDPYAGEIAYTDHHIGMVIDRLKKLGLYDSTMIVIVGDHGEMLGDHGEAEHGYFIYQQAVNVPMIFKLPKQKRAKRIEKTVGLIDIAPTIYSLTGINPPSGIEGVDISPLFDYKNTGSTDRFIYCESFTPTKHNASPLLGIVTDGWKYIQTTRPELYNLKMDPQEKTNMASKEPKRAHMMEETLKLLIEDNSISDNDSELELDEAGKKRLESLGYIATKKVDTSMVFDRESPDPKDLIKFHNIKNYNNMATELVKNGKLNEAAIAYTQLIEHYKKTAIKHSMSSIHFNLAIVYQKLGNKELSHKEFYATIELLKEEIAGNPDSSLLYTQLGNAYASVGNLKSASGAFKKNVTLAPDLISNYINLANSLLYRKEFDQGIDWLEMGIERMTSQQRPADTERLRKYLDYIENAKAEYLKKQKN